MKKWEVLFVTACLSLSVLAEKTNEVVVLTPKKDSAFRSNEILNNNGGNSKLYIAGVSYIRTIISFDLKKITQTNKIEKVELRIHLLNKTGKKPVSFVIKPMVRTKNNIKWGEGTGNLGVQGQKSRLGDANFIFSSSRDKKWESAEGKTVKTILDRNLWLPAVATFSKFEWKENTWLTVPLNKEWIESIRKSKLKTVTFGLWGTSGDQYYFLSAKESSSPPQLRITFKPDKKKKKKPQLPKKKEAGK